MSMWERFCREQARESAKKFFDKVRRFKERNPSTSDVHDSVFANEFSAAFLEESLVMTSGSGIVNGLGVNSSSGISNTMTMTRQGVVDQRKGGPQSKGGGRSWWNIFKWSKFSKTEGGNRRTSTTNRVTVDGGAVVVLEGVVNLLNLNDCMQTLTWQHCRLVLMQEQGNHQLEVFCPPKNTTPKMSLFCFLIEDVRSTSLLEIPDSSSSFVIKSQNHGEYVFDAGSEASKQQWIKTIQQFSSKQTQNPVSNGCLPPSSLSSSRPTINGYASCVSNIGAETPERSPTRAGGSTMTRSSTLPRSSHRAAVTVSQDVTIEELTSSPVVYGRRNSSEPAREGTSRISALLSAEQHCDSDESILCDVSSFIRSQPQKSPSRHQKAQSLFVESPSTASWHSTPPPIPKRSSIPSTPRSTTVGHTHSNQAAFSSAAPTGTSSAHSSPYRGGSRRKLSHPNIEVYLPVPGDSLHELPSPGNLETCSQSSSSSALHPISLAAVQRTSQRKSSVPSSPTETQKLQSAQRTQEALIRGRKISAPVLAGPNSFQLEDPWKGVRRLNGRFDPYRSDERLNIMEEANLEEIPVGTRCHNRSQSSGTDAIPRNASPPTTSILHAADSSDGFQSSPESGAVSLLKGLEAEATNSGTSVPPLDNQTRVDDAPSDSNTRINSSSSEDAESHPQDTHDGNNPIYVETTEAQGYSQSVTFTQHPYESWATTHQDVQNLRALAHFPWFHGMISRTNASQLVLAAGEEGSGQYLVRQSESREGDFVLTFNYHNRAKHLRMAVDESGCNIQHLWFSDVMGMLEYFKINSIPLESFWLNDDVKLTTYIERSASDTFRTTTIVNVDRLHRSPPRRTRSLHLGMSRAVGTHGTSTSSNPNTPSPTEQQLQGSGGNQGPQSNSLPHTARNSTGWRQLFRSQRSSSAGNVGRVQRRHSANAGSLLDTRRVVSHDRSENNYVFRY